MDIINYEMIKKSMALITLEFSFNNFLCILKKISNISLKYVEILRIPLYS